MNIIHLPCALRNDYYTIKVIFASQNANAMQKPYTYKVHKSQKLEALDDVVVPTKYGVKIAQVWKIDEIPDIDYHFMFPYNWIIQKVDKTTFAKLELQDTEILEEGKKQENVMRNNQAREFLAKSFGNSFVEKFKQYFIS